MIMLVEAAVAVTCLWTQPPICLPQGQQTPVVLEWPRRGTKNRP